MKPRKGQEQSARVNCQGQGAGPTWTAEEWQLPTTSPSPPPQASWSWAAGWIPEFSSSADQDYPF